MPTSLSQLQAQGWKKWLSRITFTRRTNTLKSAQQQGGKISTRDLCQSCFQKIQIEGKKFSAYFAGKFLQVIARIEASDRDMAEEIRDLLSGEG